ncbi:MAG: 3-dehydroquinate synthase, partial [Phycisphaerae bacterium]
MSSAEQGGFSPEADVYQQRISVPFEYPVHFARDVFRPDSTLLIDVLNRLGEDRRHRCAVVIDDGVTRGRPELLRRIKEYFHDAESAAELAGEPIVLPGGEPAKRNWQGVRDLIWTLGNLHLDRQSFLIAIGGGSVLDMAGFAASIVHRGVRLVRMPSTVLAQNDAGIGVKNGMDEHGQKNFIGTFAPPFAVINDFSLLSSLSDHDWAGGMAEAFKVAIIKDADFFDWTCRHAGALKQRDADAMEQLIRRCAVIHLDHIRTSGDPFEFGSARPLDFGHWAGHRLEVMSQYSLGHGQGVAIGIALDSLYAMHRGLLSEPELKRILAGLSGTGLPVYSELLERRSGDGRLVVLEGLQQFREHLGGRLNVTLPSGIGSRVEVHSLDEDVLA